MSFSKIAVPTVAIIIFLLLWDLLVVLLSSSC